MPAETWGWRLKRARMQVAGMNLDAAVAAVGKYMLTSPATIVRLEKEPVAPRTTGKDKQRRQLATLLCYLYGIDPGELGLGPDDLPPGIRAVVDNGGGPDASATVTIRYSQPAPALTLVS